jgi:lipopolysaccharide/colanic/teichoic acid biosynthesis glycosyltransferase
MHPEIQIQTKHYKWVNVSEILYEKDKNDLKLFYIGNNDEIMERLSYNFHSGFRAENIVQAEKFINDFHFHSNKIPDVIFIDVALEQHNLIQFCSYLNKESLLARTPVIFNEKRLDSDQIDFLKQHHLVDDVINFDLKNINYHGKVLFLKRLKRKQSEILPIRNRHQWKEGVKKFSLSMKRVIDIILASIAILILLPLFLLIAFAIKLESKGPVFYTSKRAGRGYKIFDFYKFRSMVTDADKKIDSLSHLNQYDTDEKGPKFFKISNDPRVTKLGKILRNTSMDELPQLFNVLKGDMSIVGNRPLPLYEAETLTTNLYVERFMAPAGITGLWQIKKRGKAEMSTQERMSLDIVYARRVNPLFDLWIMMNTPVALLQKSDV